MSDEIVGTLKAHVFVSAYTDRGEECYEEIIPEEAVKQVREEQAAEYRIPTDVVNVSFAVNAYPSIEGVIEVEIDEHVKGTSEEAEQAVIDHVINKFYRMQVDKIDVRFMEFQRNEWKR